MSDLIKHFFELERQIWNLVGCEEVYYAGVQDGTDSDFYLGEYDLLFGAAGTEDYYGGEVRCCFRGEQHTIVVYDDGQGNRQCVILLDNGKETTYEAFEGEV